MTRPRHVAYTPPRWLTQDGERIQAALLDPRTAQPRRRTGLLLALWAWLAITGLCLAAALAHLL